MSETIQVDADIPVHDARELTKGGVQARIQLDSQIYTLRITRSGKLILTK
jgi:hemin uptake protein HemP